MDKAECPYYGGVRIIEVVDYSPGPSEPSVNKEDLVRKKFDCFPGRNREPTPKRSQRTYSS